MGHWNILGSAVTWRPRPCKAIGLCLKAEGWGAHASHWIRRWKNLLLCQISDWSFLGKHCGLSPENVQLHYGCDSETSQVFWNIPSIRTPDEAPSLTGVGSSHTRGPESDVHLCQPFSSHKKCIWKESQQVVYLSIGADLSVLHVAASWNTCFLFPLLSSSDPPSDRTSCLKLWSTPPLAISAASLQAFPL